MSVEAPQLPPAPIPLAPPDATPYDRTPPAAAILRRILDPIERLFEYAYGWRWNPLNRSGPIALALLLFVTVTGVVLLLFYRIGTPYESIVRIQEQVWVGRWMRALHRYASDLAVVFVLFHALRMMVQGRTWGPRVLAWVSGLVLTLALLVCGWTGYLLVWDAHALIVGRAGAELFDALPLFSTPIGRTFSGAAPVLSSFFFLNLFLHMGIPLVMALILWIHTSRLARSHWLPERHLLWTLAIVLTALSLLVPAPLDPPADPLVLGDRASFDWFFGFWIPLSHAWPAGATWALALAFTGAVLFVPLWWRPRRELRPQPSRHNQAACTGCEQCMMDCPFEAISMVPRTTGRGSDMVAQVNAARCVSCGLCAGSCDQLAIGPADRSGQDQLRAARTATQAEPGDATVVITCTCNDVGDEWISALAPAGRVLKVHVDCLGSLHPMTAKRFLGHFRGVFAVGCPGGRCRSREGVALAVDRLLRRRHPADDIDLDLERLRVFSGGAGERDRIAAEFERFLEELGADRGSAAPPEHLVHVATGPPANPGGRARRLTRAIVGAVVTVVCLGGVATLSRLDAGSTPSDAAVRLAWRLPGQSYRDCRELTPDEIAALPQHMRRTEDCTTVFLTYRLAVSIDGHSVLDERIAPLGVRGDRPLFVERDVRVAPGARRIEIRFAPVEDPSGTGARLALDTQVAAAGGRAILVTLDEEAQRLVVSGSRGRP